VSEPPDRLIYPGVDSGIALGRNTNSLCPKPTSAHLRIAYQRDSSLRTRTAATSAKPLLHCCCATFFWGRLTTRAWFRWS